MHFAKAVAGLASGFDEAIEEYRYRSANMEPRSRLFSSWWIPAMLPNVLKVMLRNFKATTRLFGHQYRWSRNRDGVLFHHFPVRPG